MFFGQVHANEASCIIWCFAHHVKYFTSCPLHYLWAFMLGFIVNITVFVAFAVKLVNIISCYLLLSIITIVC